MSLLLDALKKAAKDKQANAGNTTPAPAPVEQELTLDLDELPEPASSQADITPDSPAIEEPALLIEDQQPATRDSHEDLPTLAADITPPPSEIRHEAAIVPKPARPEPAKPAAPLELEPEQAVIKQPASAPQPSASPSNAAALAAQLAAAKQRDALNMMINKSRQSDDRRRNTLRYGLAVFSLLLILLTGSYFYSSSEPTQAMAAPPQAETDTEAAVAAEEVAVAEPVQQAVATQLAPVQPPPVQQASSGIPMPRRASARAAAPVQDKPAAAPVQFTKTTRPDPIESLLGQAYEKFQAGDYEGANQLYAQVLQREADNRDGLLGAAAIAMKQQHFEFARQKYQRLLVLDPKDSLASAGISTIDMDVRDESKLKFMLREQPQASHLYFALGALYASETRWAEAQQAYFSAYSGDSKNADYAYNLAVSLDQLGQYQSASRYYQKALQLGESRRAGFVTANVQSRIDQIARLPDPVK